MDAKMVKSRAEAKRLIAQGAVEIEGRKIEHDAEIVFIRDGIECEIKSISG